MYYEPELYHHGILGQKWGVRRYQNEDGTLTAAGQKRYDRDVQENKSKKKDNRIDTSNPDPSRWSREDTERQKNVVDASSKVVNELKNIEKQTRPTATTQKMDLSNMSDKELRDRINRELLERQYNNMFAEVSQPTVSKGRETVQNTLEVAGSVLAVTSSALGIALAMKQLKG
jgi:hypothetical protein